MARPRKPTKLLEQAGRLRKDPQRARPNEPEAPPGDWTVAPEYFDENQTAAWHDIVDQVPAGVLSKCDGVALEVAATLLARFRIGEAATASDVGQLRIMLAQFGMTPSSRASLEVEKTTVNKFDEL